MIRMYNTINFLKLAEVVVVLLWFAGDPLDDGNRSYKNGRCQNPAFTPAADQFVLSVVVTRLFHTAAPI